MDTRVQLHDVVYVDSPDEAMIVNNITTQYRKNGEPYHLVNVIGQTKTYPMERLTVLSRATPEEVRNARLAAYLKTDEGIYGR